MCGIIGYVGQPTGDELKTAVLDALGEMEYRGYDSAGSAWIDPVDGLIHIVKKAGKVSVLRKALNGRTMTGQVGIGHTRWATHGPPSDLNAHPHTDRPDEQARIALVHNGIIENAAALKERLEREGWKFATETDTEVMAVLIGKFLSEGDELTAAIQKLHTLVVGAYAIAVLDRLQPDRLVAARHGSPLVVGFGPGCHYVASDKMAFVNKTKTVLELEDDELVVLTATGYDHRTMTNQPISRQLVELQISLDQIAKGGCQHFMLKEILEQGSVLRNTLVGRVRLEPEPRVQLGGLMTEIETDGQKMTVSEFLERRVEQVIITACGTSYHAGLIGERMIEKLTGLPVKVVYASEFVTGFTPVNSRTLCLTISQSGETKDTIAAARKARNQGAIVWNICNVVGSSLTRVAHSGVYLHVGPEIGVASTKAFTAQVVALAVFTLKLVELRQPGHVPTANRQAIAEALLALPGQIDQVIADASHVREIALQFACRTHWLCRGIGVLSRPRTPRLIQALIRLFGPSAALYLGRGYNVATAREGALKLKEISYLQAGAEAAGEMKHGPIALIDRRMPVIVIAPLEGEDEATYAKVISNIEEVAARRGRVILVASQNDPMPERLRREGKVERILRIPPTLAMLTPVLASIPLQLLAYYIAEMRGCPIDQPRNLAKSVTVE